MTKEDFGFDEGFAERIDPARDAGLVPLRVTAVHKGECEASDGERTTTAKMTGRLRHRAKSRADYPTVGDWVMVEEGGEDDIARIHRVLDRHTVLERKTAGRTVRRQLIAANVDVAFVMQAFPNGVNLRRLERYLVMAHEGGVEPVVLLGKSDLVAPTERERIVADVRERIGAGTRVLAFSNETGEGLDAVGALFEPRRTHCLIGVSGVGKTTLLNKLLGDDDALFTLPVREKDGKGVHSTTWRELIVLENGALVVDTPGMRELGHLDPDAGLEEAFDDLFALAEGCRFRDCAHVGEVPGCAVIAAVRAGRIDRERYDHFARLMEELDERERRALAERRRTRAAGRYRRSLERAPEE